MGGFSVDNATLTRFFAFHFLLPFIVAAITMIHLIFLHETGSNNPAGINSDADKISFHPYFSYKDLLGFVALLMGLTCLALFTPNLLGDPDNFTPANPLVTPPHIKPTQPAQEEISNVETSAGLDSGVAGSVVQTGTVDQTTGVENLEETGVNLRRIMDRVVAEITNANLAIVVVSIQSSTSVESAAIIIIAQVTSPSVTKVHVKEGNWDMDNHV